MTSRCPMKLQIAEGNRPDLEMAPSKNQMPKLPPPFHPSEHPTGSFVTSTIWAKRYPDCVSVTSHCPMKLQIAEENRPDLEMAPSKNQMSKLPPSGLLSILLSSWLVHTSNKP